jgi:lysophospholipid acyltransferase (LPLAT)-like uncharacterized protein
MRVISSAFVGTIVAAFMFIFVLLTLAMFHKAPSLITFTSTEYAIAGVAALVVFGTFMWRVIRGSSARQEANRFFEMVNDPGSSTD